MPRCKAKQPSVSPAVYSINQFAEAHGISVDMCFRLQRRGLGPVTMKIGSRTLISLESAERWRRERETMQPEDRINATT